MHARTLTYIDGPAHPSLFPPSQSVLTSLSLLCVSVLSSKEAFVKVILDDLARVASSARLNRFEYVANAHLDTALWTPESGLVTAALKNKRPVLQETFSKQIQRLYAASS